MRTTTTIHHDTAKALIAGAAALEAEAISRRNKKYRHAYTMAAAHYRREAAPSLGFVPAA